MKWDLVVDAIAIVAFVALLGMIAWEIQVEIPHLVQQTALRQEISRLDQETIRALQEASQWDQETINIQQETIQIYQGMLHSSVDSR